MTNAAHIAGSFVRLAVPKQHDPSEALPVDKLWKVREGIETGCLYSFVALLHLVEDVASKICPDTPQFRQRRSLTTGHRERQRAWQPIFLRFAHEFWSWGYDECDEEAKKSTKFSWKISSTRTQQHFYFHDTFVPSVTWWKNCIFDFSG